MAESTLNLGFVDYRAKAGEYLGYGRDPTGWDEHQAAVVEDTVEAAQRMFYFAAQPDPRREAHSWSFLKPMADVQLTAGAATAPLPDDFGGFEGSAAVSLAGTAGGYWRADEFSEEQLKVRYAAAPGVTGRPLYFAEQQGRGTTPQRSERSAVYVYPLPDQAYTLAVKYRILPNAITAARPFPYGGAAHAQTMLAAVRAAAEAYPDDRRGTHYVGYQQLLAASVSADRAHQPKTLGVNYDPSDARAHGYRGRHWPLGIGHLGTADWY